VIVHEQGADRRVADIQVNRTFVVTLLGVWIVVLLFVWAVTPLVAPGVWPLINIAETSNARRAPDVEGDVFVSVTAQGQIFFQDQPVEVSRLDATLLRSNLEPEQVGWWSAACGDVAPIEPDETTKLSKLIRRVSPSLPEVMRRMRWSGVVVAQTMIDASGNVCAIRIVERPAGLLGEELAQSVRAAVLQWKYRPAMRKGKTTPVLLSVTVRIET